MTGPTVLTSGGNSSANGQASVVVSALDVPSGSAVYVAVGQAQGTGSTVTGVTDTNGNTYTRAVQSPSGFVTTFDVWHAENVVGGASTDVTVAYTGNESTTVVVVVVQGQAAQSLGTIGTATNFSTSATSFATTMTTTKANALVLSITALLRLTGAVTFPPPYVSVNASDSASLAGNVESDSIPSPGPTTATIDTGDSTTGCGICIEVDPPGGPAVAGAAGVFGATGTPVGQLVFSAARWLPRLIWRMFPRRRRAVPTAIARPAVR
ncbi:MAG: hypothetical protein IVW52_05285 [Acidimicrobiales bacterium]|nr:hypothetical protein [Acidimicrobiales bacterium]